MARYIDAEDALFELETRFFPQSMEYTLAVDIAKSLLIKAPTADVEEVKHAKWEINCDGYYPYCSNCKTEPKNGVMSKRCPECGAKMDGGNHV
jgi:Zn finger protein HypA/HybF involved in hydrogenase expression